MRKSWPAVIAERDELQQRLDEQAAVAPSPVVPAPVPALATPTWPAAAATTWPETPQETESEAAPAVAWDEQAAPVDEPEIDEPETSYAAAPSTEFEAPREAEPVFVPEASRVEEPSPAPAPYAPTSFIDKYRHLLDDDGEPEPSPRLSRPILDDEYLSPAKSSESPAPPDEDSDEALEAYMSNMMRRVRGEPRARRPSPARRQRDSDWRDAVLARIRPRKRRRPLSMQPAVDDEPEIDLDANGMLRLVRKESASTDMSALRELANTSARTAIAHHRQRRHVESAVTKAAICADRRRRRRPISC